MSSSNLYGYYTHGKRLALVKSFCEGISVRYVDDALRVERVEHYYASTFKPISLAVALATGLHETADYVNQVSHYELVRRLVKEPLFALLSVHPESFKPGMTVSQRRTGSGGSCGLSVSLRRVSDQHDKPDHVFLTFYATFTFFDAARDEDVNEGVTAYVMVPRTLLESFNAKTYAAWLKREIPAKRKRFAEYIKKDVAGLRARIAELRALGKS